MRKFTAAMVGLIVAPLIASTLGSALTPIDRTFDLIGFLGLIPIMFFFSWLGTMFFGAPLFLLLFGLGFVNMFTAICGGAFVGMIVAAILYLPRLSSLGDLLVLGAIGAVSTLGF